MLENIKKTNLFSKKGCEVLVRKLWKNTKFYILT